MCRDQIAWLGIPSGVKVHKVTVLLNASCRKKGFRGQVRFGRRAADGSCVVKKVAEHDTACVVDLSGNSQFGQDKKCSPAYTSQQIG